MAAGNPKLRGRREPEPGLSHAAYRGVRLTAADAAAGWRLSTEAGWNQTEGDWRFLLTAGSSFGFEDCEGTLVASATVLAHGQRIAWVGMVVVTASARRQGLATRLLAHAVRLGPARRLTLLLDATADGRPVYLRLGFRDIGNLARWRAEAPAATAGPEHSVKPIATVADLDRWAEWDAERFGVDRGALLRALRASRPDLALQILGNAGEWLGFCLGRAGRTATQIGPVVAASEAAALALLGAALERVREPVLVDVMESHAGFERELAARGFRAERGFVRMALNLPGGFGWPEGVYAAAGPEFG